MSGLTRTPHIDETQASIDRVPVPPSGNTLTLPAVIGNTRPLLAKPKLELDKLADFRDKINAADSFASAWRRANAQLNEAASEIDELLSGTGLSQEQCAALQGKKAVIERVRRTLWDAANNADVTALSADLSSISASRLSPDEHTLSRASFSALMLNADGHTRLLRSLEQHNKFNRGASDEERVELFSRAIRLGDKASLLWASVLALLTGLNTYYFDKPFGTLADYVTLFLWAAGTKLVLDIGAALIDRFLGSAATR